jgi:hypothetical protein
MGKVFAATVADAPQQDFDAGPGISARGSVKSRAVISGSDRPLWLRQHELAPGAGLAIEAPQVEHLFYVWEGSVEATDATANSTPGGSTQTLPEKSVVAVSRRARANIKAGPAGATLLQFCSATGEQDARAAAGKPHVHVIGSRGILRGMHKRLKGPGVMWMNSTCPDCGMWLHGSSRTGQYNVELHAHTEDEIIVVTHGEMVLGRRSLGPGGAVAVDGNTRYSFKSGEPGLGIINYRATEPWYVGFKEGMVPLSPIKESDAWPRGHVLEDA